MTGKLPPSASVAHAEAGDKLHAPAAARNAEALSGLLQSVSPATGVAMELASGTGQHVVRFAADMPGLEWHPTEVDDDRLRSIDAYVAETDLKNVANATFLNAAEAGWAAKMPQADLLVLINLLHLIPAQDAQTILTEAARALERGGTFVLYGPFSREGALTSDGDKRFDAQLRAADPAIGYKDTRDTARWLSEAGFQKVETREMPANNLAFITRRSG